MNTKASKDDELADSTDWLSTPLSNLSSVESALRCQVCKEFFATPMITSCSHTFCSLCIRRCLGNDGKCPTCRASDQEVKLKHNLTVEELVDAFKMARPAALKFARDLIAAELPNRKRNAAEEGGGSPVKKRTRSSKRTWQSNSKPMVLDSEGDDDDYSPEDEEQDDGLSACPICHVRMTEREVQTHIDQCLSGGGKVSKKPTILTSSTQLSIAGPSNLVSKPLNQTEKLAQPHYDSLNDRQLQKKLTDLGISAAGNRTALKNRCKEWILLWNSNCDRKEPKSKAELKKQLNIWEMTQGHRASTSNTAYSTGLQIKDKDFDGKAWSDQHSGSFEDLIAQARARRMAPKKDDQVVGEKSKEGSSRSAEPAHRDLKIPSHGPVEHSSTTIPSQIPEFSFPGGPPERQDSPIVYDSAHPQFPQEAHSTIPPPSTQYQRMAQDMDPYTASPSSQSRSPYQGLTRNKHL